MQASKDKMSFQGQRKSFEPAPSSIKTPFDSSDSDQAPTAPTTTPQSASSEPALLSPCSAVSRRPHFETTLTEVDFDPQSRPHSSQNTPQRSKSARIMNRLSSLFGIKSSPAPAPEVDESNLDPLPFHAAGLDGRLNYHVSELEKLHATATHWTEVIKTHETRRRMIRGRTDAAVNMKVSLEMMKGAEMGMRDGRTAMLPFVRYHISEVRRIAKRMVLMKEELGENVAEQGFLKNDLLDHNLWDALFIQ